MCSAGAMDEVDWLKSRLEHLETSIVSQGQGSRGELQGRPVSRRGRSGKGGSASEPSEQVHMHVPLGDFHSALRSPALDIKGLTDIIPLCATVIRCTTQ